MKRLARRLLIAFLPMLILGLSSCTLSPEARRDRYLASGKKLVEKKDYRRAVLEFKNALKAKPRYAEIYYQLGLADIGANDVREAALCFQKAIELNPKHVGAQLGLAQLLASATNPKLLEEANKRLVSLLSDNPDNPDALNALALTELKLGKVQDGMVHLSRLLEKDPRQLTSSKPHCTNHSTDRYTASQLVWNARAVSRQLNRRAQRAKNPIMAQVTGRLPSLQGMCSTTPPCSAHPPRRGA